MSEPTSLTAGGEPGVERILVCDDEEIIREMLFSYLTDEGYTVDMAADGTEAFALLDSEVTYEIVITDIRLPAPNGMEILKKAKETRKATEVIVMTAFSTEDMAIEAVRLGAYDYLKKPIDDLGLFALLIRQIIQKQSLARENQRLMEDLRRKNSELQNANGRLTSMATTDPLTGVHNRRYLLMRLEQQFQQTRRYGDPFAVVMVDIDHFKLVNDRFDHQVGDQVLCHFAETVSGLIRGSDLFGRYGGEEFILLLHNATTEDAQQTCERLRAAIEARPFESGNVTVPFTVSVGFTVSPPGEFEAAGDMVQAADAGLYEAKEGGRNCVVLKAGAVAEQPSDASAAAVG